MKTAMLPDFDSVQGTMEEAIEDGLKHLSDEDLDAIAGYIMSVEPIGNEVRRGR